MSEEINKRNNELSDAELEQVGGGVSEEDVQEICATCPSRENTVRYSCTYEGGDWFQLYNLMHKRGVVSPGRPSTNLCPYLKRL